MIQTVRFKKKKKNMVVYRFALTLTLTPAYAIKVYNHMETTRFSAIEANSIKYWILLAALGLATLIGYLSSHHMDVEGHHISGMSNQIVWGFPHVIAIFS